MNFFTRWLSSRFGCKDSAVAKIIFTGMGTTTSWTPHNYRNFAEESFMKNVVAFRCILKIAESVASVPWTLFRKLKGDKTEPVESHPVIPLLERANPQESFAYIVMATMAYLLMSGNAFMECVAPATGPNRMVPKELYSLRPDRVKIETNEQRIIGYTYTVGGYKHTFEVEPVSGQCDLLHLKSFNPVNDLWGMAITEPTAREIDTANQATTWGKKMLENEGRPGLVATVDPEVTDEQFDLMERLLREKHSGPINAGANLLLRGGTVTPYGWSPKEMDFIQSNQELARRIALGYGVPSMLLGIPGDNTYSNYQEARLAFWQETVFWYLRYLRGEFNNWLFFDEPDLTLDYVLDDVPALSVQRDKLWERAEKASFLKINEKREMVGYEPVKGGDVILIPATMLPIGEEVPPVGEGEAGKETRTREELKKEGYTDEEIDSMLGESG